MLEIEQAEVQTEVKVEEVAKVEGVEKKEKTPKAKKEKAPKEPKEPKIKIPAGQKEGTKTKAIVDAYDATGSVKAAVAQLKEAGVVITYQQAYNTLVRLGKVVPAPKKVAEGETSEGASVDITKEV